MSAKLRIKDGELDAHEEFRRLVAATKISRSFENGTIPTIPDPHASPQTLLQQPPPQINNAASQRARQLAYTFYTDLTNRKVAMPIDWQDDTLIDIYNSWNIFFDNSVALLRTLAVDDYLQAKEVEACLAKRGGSGRDFAR